MKACRIHIQPCSYVQLQMWVFKCTEGGGGGGGWFEKQNRFRNAGFSMGSWPSFSPAELKFAACSQMLFQENTWRSYLEGPAWWKGETGRNCQFSLYPTLDVHKYAYVTSYSPYLENKEGVKNCFFVALLLFFSNVDGFILHSKPRRPSCIRAVCQEKHNHLILWCTLSENQVPWSFPLHAVSKCV